MCFTHQLCNATRAAWDAQPSVTDVMELYVIGYEVARTNREDVGISEFQLSETILMHASREAELRNPGPAHAAA